MWRTVFTFGTRRPLIGIWNTKLLTRERASRCRTRMALFPCRRWGTPCRLLMALVIVFTLRTALTSVRRRTRAVPRFRIVPIVVTRRVLHGTSRSLSWRPFGIASSRRRRRNGRPLLRVIQKRVVSRTRRDVRISPQGRLLVISLTTWWLLAFAVVVVSKFCRKMLLFTPKRITLTIRFRMTRSTLLVRIVNTLVFLLIIQFIAFWRNTQIVIVLSRFVIRRHLLIRWRWRPLVSVVPTTPVTPLKFLTVTRVLCFRVAGRSGRQVKINHKPQTTNHEPRDKRFYIHFAFPGYTSDWRGPPRTAPLAVSGRRWERWRL